MEGQETCAAAGAPRGSEPADLLQRLRRTQRVTCIARLAPRSEGWAAHASVWPGSGCAASHRRRAKCGLIAVGRGSRVEAATLRQGSAGLCTLCGGCWCRRAVRSRGQLQHCGLRQINLAPRLTRVLWQYPGNKHGGRHAVRPRALDTAQPPRDRRASAAEKGSAELRRARRQRPRSSRNKRPMRGLSLSKSVDTPALACLATRRPVLSTRPQISGLAALCLCLPQLLDRRPRLGACRARDVKAFPPRGGPTRPAAFASAFSA